MTDAAYHAKEWLEQCITLWDDAEKTRRKIEMIENKLNSAVSNYEHGTRLDPVQAQARREDMLIDYSEKQAEFERKYGKFVRQEIITMNLLDRMKNKRHATILYRRFIIRESIEKMAKAKLFDYNRTYLYDIYRAALEEFEPLLRTEEPQAIQEAEEHIKQARAKLYQNRQITA